MGYGGVQIFQGVNGGYFIIDTPTYLTFNPQTRIVLKTFSDGKYNRMTGEDGLTPVSVRKYDVGLPYCVTWSDGSETLHNKNGVLDHVNDHSSHDHHDDNEDHEDHDDHDDHEDHDDHDDHEDHDDY